MSLSRTPADEDDIVKKGKKSPDAPRRRKRIRLQDPIDPKAKRVQTVKPSDVLLGRGRGSQESLGNMRMREVINQYKAQYHSLPRYKKQALVSIVHKEIVEGGARFLTRSADGEDYVEVAPPLALEKVSTALRCKKNWNKIMDASKRNDTPSPSGDHQTTYQAVSGVGQAALNPLSLPSIQRNLPASASHSFPAHSFHPPYPLFLERPLMNPSFTAVAGINSTSLGASTGASDINLLLAQFGPNMSQPVPNRPRIDNQISQQALRVLLGIIQFQTNMN